MLNLAAEVKRQTACLQHDGDLPWREIRNHVRDSNTFDLIKIEQADGRPFIIQRGDAPPLPSVDASNCGSFYERRRGKQLQECGQFQSILDLEREIDAEIGSFVIIA